MNTNSIQLRYQKSRYITVLGAALNIFLGFIKIIFGMLSHSHALVADGIHSFADLLTDILVLIAAKFGNQAADADHPYGHDRIETVATVALAILLISIGLLVIADAIEHLLKHPTAYPPHFSAIVIALLSVVSNELFFRYSLQIAKQVQSNLIRANAWHRRSDAASSLIVLISIIASHLGFNIVDIVAAVIVGGLIIRMGYKLGLSSVRELVDTGLDEKSVDDITDYIKTIPGVRSVHDLRSRLMGGKVFLDVHVLVHPYISVSEGHYIGEQVGNKLLRRKKKIADVVVHVDPENDEVVPSVLDLPSREQILKVIEKHCQQLSGFKEIININLHYLSGKIYIEIILPLTILDTPKHAESLTQHYRSALSGIVEITSVILLFEG